MIVANVHWQFAEPLSRSGLQSMVETTASAWIGRPGLIRKYDAVGRDPAEVVGFYVWETREQAEAACGADFRGRVGDLFGETDLRVSFHEVVAELHAETGRLTFPGRDSGAADQIGARS